MAKWTRLNIMEVGPNDSNNSNSMITLGKLSTEETLFVSCKTGAVTCFQKRAKVDLGDGVLDSTSVGVHDHLCREQRKFSVGTAKGLGTLGQFETFTKS